MAETISIFDKIAQLGSNAGFMGVRLPGGSHRWQTASCGFGRGPDQRRTFVEAGPKADPEGLLDLRNPRCWASPAIGRKNPKAGSDLLQQRYQEQGRNSKPSGDALNSLWHELKNPASAIRELDLARLPADALAFYGPSISLRMKSGNLHSGRAAPSALRHSLPLVWR